MTELRKTFDQQYLKSCMDKEVIYFSEITEESTPHQLNFDLSSFFTPEALNKVNGKILPLLELDLNEINDSYNSKIPILYHEMTSLDWIISKLDDEGKIEESYLLDYDGKKVDFSENKEEDFFEEGIEETLDVLDEYQDQYLRIIKMSPIKPLGKIDHSDSEKLEEWSHENWIEAEEKYDSDELSYWGPLIRKTQADFAIPFDPQSNKDFVFVGQIDIEMLDLCDFSYYMFYNPDKKIVAQLMQMT